MKFSFFDHKKPRLFSSAGFTRSLRNSLAPAVFFGKYFNQKVTRLSDVFSNYLIWRKKPRLFSSAGFTLIEMVTVIGIFVVVTGIILANLPSFRSSSALDLVAQEVATQVRGAQVYAMSTVVSDTTGNVFGYLLQIPPTGTPGSKDFKLCACTTINSYDLCRNSCRNLSSASPESADAKYIESYHLGGKVEFGAGEVNLYFKRPMGSLYCGPGGCDSSFPIKVTDRVNSRWIVVGSSGSISITNRPPEIPIQ